MGGERNTVEALFFPISLIFVIIKSPLSIHKYARKTHTHTPLFSFRKDSTFHCFHGAKTPGSVIKNMSFPIGLSPPFNYSVLVPDYPIFSSLSITLFLERFGGGGGNRRSLEGNRLWKRDSVGITLHNICKKPVRNQCPPPPSSPSFTPFSPRPLTTAKTTKPTSCQVQLSEVTVKMSLATLQVRSCN